jgi:uncharacterized repeat protein (TIGR03806 family)
MSYAIKVSILMLAGFIVLSAKNESANEPAKQLLSQYGFFTGILANLEPAAQVIPYEVIAPLFSDHAEKLRFIALPNGGKMYFNPNGLLQVPDGTTVIKNFFYTHKEKRTIKETRLLIRQNQTWKALTYVWKDDQTDAMLEIAGAELPTTWHDENGQSHQFTYAVPNINQCKGCHSVSGKFELIGLSHDQLNFKGQLEQWQTLALLDTTNQPTNTTRLVDYTNHDAPIQARARAYLHANCGYCHHPLGPASTSGLNLDISETDPLRIGIYKTPVAAGKGTGNRQYSILPGHPDKSILLYRMETNDPGERMPELGRSLPDDLGIALIRQWIKEI